MVARRLVPLALLLLAGCSSSYPLETPQAPPPPVRRRPDGIRYGLAGGVGVGSSRAGTAPEAAVGLAALGSLWVGLSVSDVVVLALRVDASTVGGDGLGTLGVHLAFFPAGHSPGPVSDLAMFADVGLGGSLAASAGTTGPSSVVGVGRVGVAWERWRVGRVSIGPFLAGEVARGAGQAQAAALGGVSMSFSSDPSRR